MSTDKKDLLLEVGTEELPPKALASLSQALETQLCAQLDDHELSYESSSRFATPRRLAVLLKGLDLKQPDRANLRFGPAVSAAFDEDGNPTKAAQGFARSCGVNLNELERSQKDGVDKLSYSSVNMGQQTSTLLPEMLKTVLSQLPVPKRMRWGSSRDEFVRPVHWLIVMLGESVVPVSLFGIESGSNTRGHRFMHNEEIVLDQACDYEEKLATVGKVVANFYHRLALVEKLVTEQADALGAQAQIDQDLLQEVTSLVEYPVALTGNFDPQFLELPPEALILALKSHQKCFCVVDGNGQLLPKFIAVSNLQSKEPARVVEGNERVIRPRLADARFFFETDKKVSLADRIPDLDRLRFQDRLGSVRDKTERVKKLAQWVAEQIKADATVCARAALLSKSDLLTQMVGEFTDLQGVMGYYYALNDGEAAAVATALNEQYQPRHAGASVPATLTGAVLAISDKLDTIVAMFGIGQPPTGSKDPFALRRSALGVLRILVEKELDLDLYEAIKKSIDTFSGLELEKDCSDLVFEFMIERLRAFYADKNIASEIFQSVLAVRPTRPLDFSQRIEAVNCFARLPEAQDLAAANKRVANILAKHGEIKVDRVDPKLFEQENEKSLHALIGTKEEDVLPMFQNGDYTAGLQALAQLRDEVDAFFDTVLVMSEDPAVQANRLALLQSLRNLFLGVADISHLHKS